MVGSDKIRAHSDTTTVIAVCRPGSHRGSASESAARPESSGAPLSESNGSLRSAVPSTTTSVAAPPESLPGQVRRLFVLFDFAAADDQIGLSESTSLGNSRRCGRFGSLEIHSFALDYHQQAIAIADSSSLARLVSQSIYGFVSERSKQ